MAIKINPRMTDVGQERLILQLARQYKHPLEAAREYETNALDAVSEAGWGEIVTGVDPRGLNFYVGDNASGMDEARMRQLPVNIGESLKKDHQDQRGEFAVGLLAFGSMGTQLQEISRVQGEQGYNLLRYSVVGERSGEKISVEFDRVTERDMDNTFYGGFEHGTRAIVRVDRKLFAKNFKPADVKRFIRETYTPLLVRDEGITFWFEDGKGERVQITAPKYRGEELLRPSTFEFQAKSKGEMVDHSLKATLRFNPKSTNETIPFFSKDVRVYDHVVGLDEILAELPLFNCGHVGGWVNEPNLSLIIGRVGINRNSNAYGGLIDTLEHINEQFWPQVKERIDSLGKSRKSAFVSKAWKVVEQTLMEYKDPLDKRSRITFGNGDDAEDDGTREIRPDGHNKPQGERVRPFKPRGPRKNTVEFSGIKVTGFDLKDRHKRSRLAGTPTKPRIDINEEHADYISNVEEGDAKIAVGYLVDVVSGPIGIHQAKQAVERTGARFSDEFEFAEEVNRRTQNVRLETLKRLNGRSKRNGSTGGNA